MRPLRSIFAFFLFVLVGGALLAPWPFFAAQWAAAHVRGCESWGGIPFHRFVHRCFIVLAILGLPRFLRGLGFEGAVELREALKPPRWRPLGWGAAIGFVSLALALGAQLLWGSRGWRNELGSVQIAGYLASAVASALAVASIEEILFRWALFGALRKIYARGFAVLVSSVIYAIVHFFSRPEAHEPITWLSGLALLPRMLRGFGDWHALVPGLFSLVLVGSILAVGYDRTGRLWFSIGLHGGWIFWVKSYNFWTMQRGEGPVWLWGTEKIFDGWLAFILLLLTAISVNGVLKMSVFRQNRS